MRNCKTSTGITLMALGAAGAITGVTTFMLGTALGETDTDKIKANIAGAATAIPSTLVFVTGLLFLKKGRAETRNEETMSLTGPKNRCC